MRDTTRSRNLQAQILVISLFFLWALTSNLLPSLIPHLKKACRLNDFQSGFIDSAYWIAYFVMAIPAANIMRRYNYKTGIIVGLIIAALGAFVFYPASEIRQFGIFLFALFMVASGMTFLETAANPYMTVLGDPKTSSLRLNFAQAFNGLGAFVAARYLSRLVLSGQEYTDAQLNSMTPTQLSTYLASESDRLKLPYVAIGIVLLIVAILFVFTRMPAVKEERGSFKLDLKVFRHRHFTAGVVAQFFYVGAQVCVSSFFIRYSKYTAGIPELEATKYLGYLLLFFMIGRYVGTILMRKIPSERLLTIYGFLNVAILAYCVFIGGRGGVMAMMGVEFFMSIMFPTIFALGIKGLGEETKLGSSYMTMAIVGGAIIPLVLSFISKQANMQLAYIVPMICFIFVFYFGFRGYKIREAVVGI